MEIDFHRADIDINIEIQEELGSQPQSELQSNSDTKEKSTYVREVLVKVKDSP